MVLVVAVAVVLPRTHRPGSVPKPCQCYFPQQPCKGGYSHHVTLGRNTFRLGFSTDRYWDKDLNANSQPER